MSLFLETIGWGGNIAFFAGSILTAKKNKWLFLCQILGNLFYVLQAGLMHNISLLILSIVLIGINIWGWMAWIPKRAKNTNPQERFFGV